LYERQSSRRYWKWLAAWRRSGFRVANRDYAFRRQLHDQRESFSAVRGILRTIIPQVALAAAAVTILAILEQRILRPWGVIDWLLLRLTGQSGSTGAGGIGAAMLNAASYDYILSTLAQVAGVFIALYFTAVSLVASTVYAQVPSDIRGMVVEEKLTDVYVRIVAFLGATSTLLLASNVIGFPLSLLNLALVALTGLFSIFGFLVIGKRVFHFFDPTQLTWDVLSQLLDCVKAAPSGSRPTLAGVDPRIPDSSTFRA
jgi:hypothetical protein